ncbi:hypothetical protein D3C71_1268260 [compost metagenome]
MDARYGHKITPDMLNLMCIEDSDKKLLTSSATQLTGVGLKGYSTSSLETEEEVKQSRLWLARYNKVKLMSKLAEEEFEQTKDAVQDWYYSKIADNLEFLLDCIAKGKLIVPSLDSTVSNKEDELWLPCSAGRRLQRDGNILTYENSTYFIPYGRQANIYGPTIPNSNHASCVVNGKTANICYRFYPANSESLMLMTGVKSVDELPEVLRFWKNSEKDVGNHLLYSADPLDWAFKNPWVALRFSVNFYFSKSGLNTLRR